METTQSKTPLRNISLLGSTGSIGTQTLDIIRHYPDRFRAVALTAHANWQLLARQALEFRPRMVAIADERYYPSLSEALEGSGISVMTGEEGLQAAATLAETEVVVGALVGYSGLPSAVGALEAGKTLALANKETLVVAGEIISEIVARKGKRILPVDSEHSAIFQCLWGEDERRVSKLILTASGGPFRQTPAEEMRQAGVRQALAHPNWDMGAKVTIDSASMMNKGFEMIEARWLFNRAPGDIEVVVHPESIVHSMVEFTDGSIKAQLGLPDMRLPIAVAINYPDRLNMVERMKMPTLNLCEAGRLTFEKPDFEKFPLLRLAYDVAERGGLLPAVMNAANEVAVKCFLEERISFADLFRVVIESVEKGESEVTGEKVSLDSINKAHSIGTDIAWRIIEQVRF